ncbi:DUF3137 domain-containing protein [Mesorhizobium sp. M2A.F.Ca.ET.037.01.1.1]|uniref:DUF3137 domain-containing protein n=1 Tax=Mesorhizobium sp. M2A.F.Ca.ET.037.01.1.1 TaxID=2496748 RepID=UPI000FCBA7F7|nr:DUF3137 domain-containing protein [Mesorhizobium sp. M2A.F.Ca.ET.037.01.1.1]RUX09969.1 DUF3137 domain-containing protein [Mesorhizobium sp. M2A.F.Ca.ET.037.01.1.1]
MEAADFMPNEAVIAGIRRGIEEYEAKRASAQRQVRWRGPVFVGLVAVFVALIAWLFNAAADPHEQWLSTPHVFLYLGGMIVAVLLYFQALRPATRLQQSFRDTLLPMIFGFVRDVRYQHGVRPNSFDRMPRETVAAFNRQSFDDVISGRYEDFPFELYEAKLWEGSAKSETTAFKGVIVAFETIEPFPGTLVAARKAGKVAHFFRGMFASKMQELSSGVEDLDDTYEFRTDNVEAARPLVTGRMAQALTWLRETWPYDQARVALSDSDGFLLMPRSKNFFELPDIAQPIDYNIHIAPMIADLGAMLATAALVRKIGARDEALD